jgi:hypothetical protein
VGSRGIFPLYDPDEDVAEWGANELCTEPDFHN